VSYRSQKSRHFRRINARSPSANWRDQPPTENQLGVLRRIERETGQQFGPSITRGEASDAIRSRLAEDPDARRAHQRARRARKRASR